jgi:hypothetical protein
LQIGLKVAIELSSITRKSLAYKSFVALSKIAMSQKSLTSSHSGSVTGALGQLVDEQYQVNGPWIPLNTASQTAP